MSGPHPHRPPPDRGETVVQLVLLVPAMLLVLFLGIQASIWFHAANVASAAAAQGAAAASYRGAAPGVAASTARDTAVELGGRLSSPPSVSGDEAQIIVTVRLDVPRVVPFFPSTVSRTAMEPRERFIPETQR